MGYPMPTGEPPEPGPPPEMRASDADRDRVIDVLRAAAGEGRLTPDEFEERMQAVLSARTFGELAPFTADLPLSQARSPSAPAAAAAAPPRGRRSGSSSAGVRSRAPAPGRSRGGSSCARRGAT